MFKKNFFTVCTLLLIITSNNSLGMKRKRDKDYESSIVDLRIKKIVKISDEQPKSIKIKTKSLEYFYQKAVSEIKNQEYSKATIGLIQFREKIQKSKKNKCQCPNYINATMLLANLYLNRINRGLDLLEDSEKIEVATNLLDEVANQNINQIQKYNAMYQFYQIFLYGSLDPQKEKKSITWLTKVATQNVNFTLKYKAHLDLGEYLFKKGSYSLALEHLHLAHKKGNSYTDKFKALHFIKQIQIQDYDSDFVPPSSPSKSKHLNMQKILNPTKESISQLATTNFSLTQNQIRPPSLILPPKPLSEQKILSNKNLIPSAKVNFSTQNQIRQLQKQQQFVWMKHQKEILSLQALLPMVSATADFSSKQDKILQLKKQQQLTWMKQQKQINHLQTLLHKKG